MKYTLSYIFVLLYTLTTIFAAVDHNYLKRVFKQIHETKKNLVEELIVDGDKNTVNERWNNWKKKFGKIYKDEEEEKYRHKV